MTVRRTPADSRFPSSDEWVVLPRLPVRGVHTDDATGHAIELADRLSKTVRIMAAMVISWAVARRWRP